MPKKNDADHKMHIAIAEVDKLATEVKRLERELFRGLPKMFEDEANTRKAQLEGLRRQLAKAERRASGGGSRAKRLDPQLVMFE